MNIVDSCGWLEHFFAPVLADEAHLLVASITIYEVSRRILLLYGAPQADLAYRAMSSLPVVHLDAAGMYQAAATAQRYKLHMADAIIWQTAQTHQEATLYTQDAAFQDVPGVLYKAKFT
jgi:predicted nucleic acid-binding protein